MKTATIVISVLLAGCSPSPPSDAEVIAYFRQHESLLNEFVRLGVEHPVLRRIEPDLRRYAKYNGVPTVGDLAAEQRAYEILATIEADFVEYWRDGEEPSTKLSSVTVPVYRWGLSLGGYSVVLVYRPAFDSAPFEASEGTRYQQIADTRWFIKQSDTR